MFRVRCFMSYLRLANSFFLADGTQDDMKFITTGPGIWVVLTVSHSNEPYIIKPQSSVNLSDKKKYVNGILLPCELFLHAFYL